MAFPRQGEVWDVDLAPDHGRTPGGLVQPALVISIDGFNAVPDSLVFVLPISADARHRLTRVALQPPEGGVDVPSNILCDHLRAVDRRRMLRLRGEVDPATLAQASAVIQRIVRV
jgi:mRNA interferase MazF